VNVIREKLQERIYKAREYSKIVSASSNSPPLRAILSDLIHLHDIAESRCHEMSPRVLSLIKRHVNTPAFFEYDASLCRDGVFYAGERIAVSATGFRALLPCLRTLMLNARTFCRLPLVPLPAG
jgi:hypothetical protein